MTTEIDYEKITIDSLNEYIREVKEKEFIATANSHLVNDLHIDSLDTVEIIINISKKLNLDLEIEKHLDKQPTSVKELVEIIKKYHA